MILGQTGSDQDPLRQRHMNRFAVVAGTGHGKLLSDQAGPAKIGNRRLERFGGGANEKRPIDLSRTCHQVLIGVDHRHHTMVKGFDQARTDLFREHSELRRPEGWIAQVVLIPADDLGL